MNLTNFVSMNSGDQVKYMIVSQIFHDDILERTMDGSNWDEVLGDINALFCIDSHYTDQRLNCFLLPEYAEAEVMGWFYTKEGIIVCIADEYYKNQEGDA